MGASVVNWPQKRGALRRVTAELERHGVDAIRKLVAPQDPLGADPDILHKICHVIVGRGEVEGRLTWEEGARPP